MATFAIELTAIIYLRGWWRLRRAGVLIVPAWRAIAFLSGLVTVWIALASPINAINSLLLTAHMLQHMLFMMAAPPLILLGAPLVPIVRGLPGFARELVGPIAKLRVAEQVGRGLTNPVAGLLLMAVVTFAWHTPILYELAIRSESLHEVEHASFFLAALAFWWPVVLPWPSRAQWPPLAMVPYLLLADLQNTALSAILTFSDRVLYPSYAVLPHPFGLSALDDQIAAGAFMWVAGSVAFVVPAIVIAVQCLSTSSRRDALSAA